MSKRKNTKRNGRHIRHDNNTTVPAAIISIRAEVEEVSIIVHRGLSERTVHPVPNRQVWYMYIELVVFAFSLVLT